MLMPFYDIIISNSNALVEYYKSFGWHIEKRMQVIHNGIKLKHQNRKFSSNKSNEPITILGVGRLTKTKRFNIFIDIIARLNQNQPIKAIIAGIGPELNYLKQ